MKKIVFCFGVVVTALAISSFAWAGGLSAREREATIAYVNSLQNPDGGFRASAKPGPSDLGATSSGIRALKYLGAEVNHKDKVKKFVLQCAIGSCVFPEAPGKPPAVRSTWFGVNALVNLTGSVPDNAEQARDFVTNNAKIGKLYPDIYFAAATLADIKMNTPKASEWIAAFEAIRHPDGSYGKGAGDTAHAAVVILRLGGTLKDPAATVKALKAAQVSSGGFAGHGDKANMPGTYTVMRPLMMFREKPDLEGVARYVGSCRNPDGGYGVAPGKPSNITFTYFASAIMHWSEELAK